MVTRRTEAADVAVATAGSAERTWGVPARAWLVLGIALTATAGNRYNVAPLAWVAAVPWLLFDSSTRWRR